jgi:tetratricopeptide (TPR) repeat protein
LALLFYALALLEKETAVVLAPLILIYASLYAERRSWISRCITGLKQSLPFFVLTAFYLALRAHILHGFAHPVSPLSWRSMALTEPSIIWLYFRHLLFPVGISGLYGLPYIENPGSAAFLIPTALLLALVLALSWGIGHLDDIRLAVFACCWIALPIIPVLWLRTFSAGDIAHDRYLYFPSVGFVLLVSLGLAKIAGRWRDHRKALQLAALSVIAIGYGLGTLTQQTYWASDLQLYERAHRIAPNDNLICSNLASALLDAGYPNDAIALFSQALAREPGYWLSNYNLGYTYYKIGRFRDAETFLRRAININNLDSDEYIYLGLSVWREGRADEAVQYIQHAIEIRPSAPGYHFALGMIRRDQNNIPAAASEFKLELKYYPENMQAWQQLNSLAKPPMSAPP